jgi:hypothetical protein
MNQQLKLMSNIEQENLKIYFILSIARSNSTTLQLALAQAPEIDRQINLPFNNYIHLDAENPIDAETIAQRINVVVEPLLTGNRKIRVIIHEHFDTLVCDDHLSLLKKFSSDFVFCFRNPRMQFFSTILVYMNELFVAKDAMHEINWFSYGDLLFLLRLLKEQPGNFDHEMDLLLKQKKIVLDELQEIRERLLKDGLVVQVEDQNELPTSVEAVFREFLSLCSRNLDYSWSQAANVLDFLKSSPGHDANIIMVDGERFLQDPANTLLYVTGKLADVSYTPDMVNDWKKFTGKDFVCYISQNLEMSGSNLWNGESQNSRRIKVRNKPASNDRLLEDHLLDDEFQKVLDKALLIYNGFSNADGQ